MSPVLRCACTPKGVMPTPMMKTSCMETPATENPPDGLFSHMLGFHQMPVGVKLGESAVRCRTSGLAPHGIGARKVDGNPIRYYALL
jgi:hypothetical protein